MYEGTAAIARNEMVPTDVEKPRLMTVATRDISERLAQKKVADCTLSIVLAHLHHLRAPL